MLAQVEFVRQLPKSRQADAVAGDLQPEARFDANGQRSGPQQGFDVLLGAEAGDRDDWSLRPRSRVIEPVDVDAVPQREHLARGDALLDR